MTIDELLSLAGLTANDEIPVWDAEAADEPTKKIRAQNLAASVKALAGLVGEAEFTEQLADKADVIVDTASGAIASFPDGAAVAAKDITIAIEPVQAGSGDPSPTNVRPISGWTGANVTRTGFNVWDEEWEANGLNPSTGENDNTRTNRIRSKNFIEVIPNAKYFWYCGGYIADSSWIYFYDGEKNYISRTSYRSDTVLVFPAGTKFIKFEIYSDYGSVYKNDICINISDPAKNGTYEPGHVVTYPISWQSEAGTIYGGTLDVTTGLLTVTMAEVDLGTLTWAYAGSNKQYFIGRTVNDARQIANSDIPNVVCSNYVCDSSFDTIYVNVSLNNRITFDNIKEVIIRDTDYTDVATFKSAMSGVQLVYELATPQTYQLTPVEIEMLLGDNNVWADTGDSTVTYRADTKLYIQKINAPTDDDMIADAQIASGKYFIVGGNLYRSTTTIPAGDTITPGTNCILTNLADALNALNT